MEHQRNTQMMQIPPRQQQQQHYADGVSFRPYSSSFMSDGVFLPDFIQQMPFNLPPSIDVDQSLSSVFSSLNLSPMNNADGLAFLPETLDGSIGGVGPAIGGGPGSIRPFRNNASNISLEEYSRVSNNQQINYSGVGLRNPLTVGPHYRRLATALLFERDVLQGLSAPGFDQWFDFDQRSDLLPTEHSYSTRQLNSHIPCSSSHPAAFLDESFLPNITAINSFYSRSNDNNLNSFSNHINGARPSTLQNHQFLNFSSLDEVRGHICTLAKDQNGCKLVQAKFENPTEEDVEIVFSEVVHSIVDIMKDQFGNYLVQKLIVVCNEDQKKRMILSLTRVPINFIIVCMSPHGTRAVQKLLENLKDPNQMKLLTGALYGGAARLATDPNGHHVIQYCLANFTSDVNEPIIDEIAEACFKVATDRSGCCVLQACVEHSRGEARNRLVTEIMVNSLHLAEDPYGNYVLQHMVGLKIPEFTSLLVVQLQGNFVSLSRNKYASNVVEKCLNESGEDFSTLIILELLRSPNASLLLIDPYANFVIQSALKVSKGFPHKLLRSLISKNVVAMRSNQYGKKVLECIEKMRIQHF